MFEPGKTILLAVATIGWLLAALIAFAVIALAGFFGVGLIGLLVWFICTQSELHGDGNINPYPERASRPPPRSWAKQYARLCKYAGIALTAIGFGGFLYELGAFAG